MAQKKLPEFVTPVGVAIFPHLLKPDTKFDANGVYGTKLAFDEDAAGEFIASLEPILDAFIEEFKNDPANKKKLPKFFDKKGAPKNVADLGTEELNEDGEPTGKVVFNFKRPAKITKQTGEVVVMRPPTLFDAEGKVIKKLDNIYSGSQLAIAGQVRAYAMDSTSTFGLSLRVNAVQVIELVEGGGRSAEGFGFGKHEGGFKADTSASPFKDEPEDDGDADEEEDGEDF